MLGWSCWGWGGFLKCGYRLPSTVVSCAEEGQLRSLQLWLHRLLCWWLCGREFGAAETFYAAPMLLLTEDVNAGACSCAEKVQSC